MNSVDSGAKRAIQCPHCSKRFWISPLRPGAAVAAAEFEGRAARCPACRQGFTVRLLVPIERSRSHGELMAVFGEGAKKMRWQFPIDDEFWRRSDETDDPFGQHEPASEPSGEFSGSEFCDGRTDNVVHHSRIVRVLAWFVDQVAFAFGRLVEQGRKRRLEREASRGNVASGTVDSPYSFKTWYGRHLGRQPVWAQIVIWTFGYGFVWMPIYFGLWKAEQTGKMRKETAWTLRIGVAWLGYRLLQEHRRQNRMREQADYIAEAIERRRHDGW